MKLNPDKLLSNFAFNLNLRPYIEVLSQQFHAWSHGKKSELPEAVLALQDSGVLISRKVGQCRFRLTPG